jgi:hypothetical protein
MKYLSILALLFIACSSSTNDIDVPNPFESEYVLDETNSVLNGTSTYKSLNNNIYLISIETNCEDVKVCPTVDIIVSNDFSENLVYTKDFDVIPGDFSDILLFTDGKCAIPFAADSGTLEISKLEDGTFTGSFDLESREINGYQPDSGIGCSEDHYSSQSLRRLSFEGIFTSIEAEETES